MLRRAWVFPSVTLAIFGGGLIWLGLVTCFRPPSYGGKPLQYWFHQLPLTDVGFVGGTEKVVLLRSVNFPRANARPSAAARGGSARATPEASVQAVCAIGTNGIGFYMRRLRERSPPILHWIQQLAWRFGDNRSVFRDVETERQRAVTGLILLKPLPPSTSKELLQLSKGSNRAIANAAWCVLEAELVDQRQAFGHSLPLMAVLNERSVREGSSGDSNIWNTNFSLTSGP